MSGPRPGTVLGTVILTAACAAIPQPARSAEPGPSRACSAARGIADRIGAGEPGVAIAVLDRGRLACALTAGSRQVGDSSQAVTRSDRFYIASLAKPLLTALVVDASRRGELSLDRSIRTWLPELPEAYSGVDLRLVLKHQAGVPDVIDELPDERVARTDNREVLRLLIERGTLAKDPGSAWDYSNSGYVLAALTLERATGKSIDELFDERLFGRLGLGDARVGADRSARSVDAYARTDDAWRRTDVRRRTIGPGGIHASLDDMIAVLRALRDGTLIPPPHLTEATAPTLTAAGKPSPYSLGFQVEDARRGLFYVASFGRLGGNRHALVWFPDRDQAYVFLSARDDLEPTSLIARLVSGD